MVNKLRGRRENNESRKQAQDAINKEYSENEKKILGIKNRLVKLKCGFKIKLRERTQTKRKAKKREIERVHKRIKKDPYQRTP